MGYIMARFRDRIQTQESRLGYSAAVWTSQKSKILCHILSDCDMDQCLSVESVHSSERGQLCGKVMNCFDLVA